MDQQARISNRPSVLASVLALPARTMDSAMAGNKKNRGLTARIPTIVRELEKATVEVARLVEEGERQAELERQRWAAQMEQWEREEAERCAAKALRESKEELFEIIETWAASKRLEEFFADAEHRLKKLTRRWTNAHNRTTATRS
ncbi:MAG: hypothetical protein WBN57_11875 [Gammaproteobacteria bacterium]